MIVDFPFEDSLMKKSNINFFNLSKLQIKYEKKVYVINRFTGAFAGKQRCMGATRQGGIVAGVPD
jgi:hypothetical protein